MTPENRVKVRVKAMIKDVCAERRLPYEIDWHAGSAYSSTLDGTGVIAGHPVVLELKRFDKVVDLTARQKIKIRAFSDAGAAVFAIVDETSLLYFLHWLRTVEPREAYQP